MPIEYVFPHICIDKILDYSLLYCALSLIDVNGRPKNHICLYCDKPNLTD